MRWEPGVLWLHVIADALTVLAYAWIPILLLTVIRKRKDISFNGLMLAFAGFILFCGATHLMSIVTIWNPLYRLEGVIKLCTGLISLTTAICLRRILPVLLKIPSHASLQQANEALARSHEELESQAAQLLATCTALEAGEEAIRKSEVQFRQLADSMPHIVWTATADGTMDYYNERWYVVTGFDRTLKGDGSWKPVLHPDDVDKIAKTWYASIASGLPFEEEYRLWDQTARGYRWQLGRAIPILDETGKIVKWYGSSTDVNEYKRFQADALILNKELETRVLTRTQELTRANDELKKTQTWLQAILNSATDVSIMALDNSGTITFFNSGTERLLGYRAEEVVGKHSLHLLYPPEECELRARQLSAKLGRPVAPAEIFLAANQPLESVISDSAYLHRDGSRIDISLAISPMIDASGERLGKLAVAVDIRPRKVLEEKLIENNLQLQQQTKSAEQANRAKSEFLSAMSHEIRTPMNAILGMADLLWESELDKTQRRYVDVFRRACGNLLNLVNDILDLSKIESGRFELETIDFDLGNLIQLTLDLIRPKVDSKKLVLTSSIAPGTPYLLRGDPMRLQQILSNLLGNAVKFTEAGGIDLKVEADAQHPTRLHFEVTDSGIGIPADKLETIFQDFTQAESSTTRRFGGTGLGLGICRRLIKRMGGELNVRSRQEEGSTFYFDAVFEPSSQEDGPHSDLLNGLGGKRVLIIDDNKTNRMIFSEMCRSWGMETSECESADDVLPMLQATTQNQQTFDLLIVDRLMSQEDGLELVAQIRAIYRQMPVLMITSDNIPGDQTKVLQYGITDYAVKPVRRLELLRLVSKLLGAKEGAKRDPDPTELKAYRKFRLLIAEDSEDNRFLLEEYLKAGPYEITFAENGALAVDRALSHNYDLILMDVQMPVMDGLTAARLIREAEQKAGRKPVPMLALTANAQGEDVGISKAAGCTAHVSKPISKQDLLNTVRKYTQPDAGCGTMPSPLALNIPPGLEEAAARYIRSRKNEVGRLRELAQAEEFDQIRDLAHNIKGTGTSYGFPNLTRLGKLIEVSSIEGDAGALTEQLLELARYVDEAEEMVQKYFATPAV